MTDFTLPFELYDSRKVKRKGRYQSTGTRVWLCTWEDRYGSWCPKVYHSKYTEGTEDENSGTPDDRLICIGVDYDGVGAGKVISGVTVPFDLCKATVSYAEYQGFDTRPREEWGASARILEVSDGRLWPDGTPCDVPLNKVFPQAVWTFPRWFLSQPTRLQSLLMAIDKVNRAYWRGFQPETLRFDFPKVRSVWDDHLGAMIDEVTFQFTFEPNGWNNVWRMGEWTKTIPPLHQTGDFEALVGGGFGMWQP